MLIRPFLLFTTRYGTYVASRLSRVGGAFQESSRQEYHILAIILVQYRTGSGCKMLGLTKSFTASSVRLFIVTACTHTCHLNQHVCLLHQRTNMRSEAINTLQWLSQLIALILLAWPFSSSFPLLFPPPFCNYTVRRFPFHHSAAGSSRSSGTFMILKK